MGERVKWVTVAELADELDVPVSTIYQWRAKGRGPRGGRFGKHVRFRRADVDAWIERCMDGGRSPVA